MTSRDNRRFGRRLRLLVFLLLIVSLVGLVSLYRRNSKTSNTVIKAISPCLPSLLPKQHKIASNDSTLAYLTAILSLNCKENRTYSQNGEDGIIAALFTLLRPKSKYYVEFGVENGLECNTRLLRERHGWKGLMLDGGYENHAINLQKEMIYPDNIVQLFQKYNVPKVFDLLSVDTDFKDYWLLKNILEAGYRPRVVISEINTFLGATASLTVPRDIKQTRWDKKTQYFGYSVAAGWHLARYYGYSMVYCEIEGVNCFFVIDGTEGFGRHLNLSDILTPSVLWKRPYRLPHKKDIAKRPYKTIGIDLQ